MLMMDRHSSMSTTKVIKTSMPTTMARMEATNTMVSSMTISMLKMDTRTKLTMAMGMMDKHRTTPITTTTKMINTTSSSNEQ